MEKNGSILSIDFPPIEQLMAIVSAGNTVKLCKLSENGTVLNCLDNSSANYKGVQSFTFHPTKPLLVTGNSDGTVKIWQITTHNNQWQLLYILKKEFCTDLKSMTFDTTGRLLAFCCQNGIVQVWRILDDVTLSYRVVMLTNDDMIVNYIAFHPNFPILAICRGNYTTKLLRMSSEN